MGFPDQKDELLQLLRAIDGASRHLISASNALTDTTARPALYFDFHRTTASSGHGLTYSIWHFLKTEPCLILECAIHNKRIMIDASAWGGYLENRQQQRPVPLSQIEFLPLDLPPDAICTAAEIILSLYIFARVDQYQSQTCATNPDRSLTWELLRRPGPWKENPATLGFAVGELEANGLDLKQRFPLLGATYLGQLAIELHKMGHSDLCQRVMRSVFRCLEREVPEADKSNSADDLNPYLKLAATLPASDAATELVIKILDTIGYVSSNTVMERRRAMIAANRSHAGKEMVRGYFDAQSDEKSGNT